MLESLHYQKKYFSLLQFLFETIPLKGKDLPLCQNADISFVAGTEGGMNLWVCATNSTAMARRLLLLLLRDVRGTVSTRPLVTQTLIDC